MFSQAITLCIVVLSANIITGKQALYSCAVSKYFYRQTSSVYLCCQQIFLHANKLCIVVLSANIFTGKQALYSCVVSFKTTSPPTFKLLYCNRFLYILMSFLKMIRSGRNILEI